MEADILKRDPVLGEIVRRLVEAFHPERIYLFGSKARGDEAAWLHEVRILARDLPERPVLKKLVAEIAPLFATRPGGYTRILRDWKNQVGDNAPRAIFELVEKPVPPEEAPPVDEATAKKEAKAAAKVAKKAAKAKAKAPAASAD